MGIGFRAMDSTLEPLEFDDGSTLFMRVTLPDDWEYYHLNIEGAVAVFALLASAMTFAGDRSKSPAQDPTVPFDDWRQGEVTIAEARRAVMAARARYNRIEADALDRTYGTVSSANLLKRLDNFSAYLEAASKAGADTIGWS